MNSRFISLIVALSLFVTFTIIASEQQPTETQDHVEPSSKEETALAESELPVIKTDAKDILALAEREILTSMSAEDKEAFEEMKGALEKADPKSENDFAALLAEIQKFSQQTTSESLTDSSSSSGTVADQPSSDTSSFEEKNADSKNDYIRLSPQAARILARIKESANKRPVKGSHVPAEALQKLTVQYLSQNRQSAEASKAKTSSFLEQMGTGIIYTVLTGFVGVLAQQSVEKFLQWAAARGLKVTIPEENFDSLPAREIIPQELLDVVDDITNQVLAKKLSVADVPLTLRSRTDRALAALQLIGGAGNGKTFLVNAAMGEIHKKLVAAGHPGIRMISLTGGDFFFTYFGEGKRAMKATFHKARQLRDQGYFAVHYIDEAHVLGENRNNKISNNSSSVASEVANVFKANATSKRNAGIAIIASTNLGFDDTAVDRRYDNKIEIKPIDTHEKKVAVLRGILRQRFSFAAKNVPLNVIEDVAKKLPSVSLDTMYLMVEEARRQASIDKNHTNKNTLTADHFEKACTIIMKKIAEQKRKEHSDNLYKLWEETPSGYFGENIKEWSKEHLGKAATDGIKSVFTSGLLGIPTEIIGTVWNKLVS